jgi:hypothetical protein
MKPVNQRVSEYVQVKPTPVKRSGQTYDQTYRFVHRALKICLFVYRRLTVADQTARLVRDTMDFLLRRYHGYCIKEHIGAHYREVGIRAGDKTDFEHVIPANLARDMLIHDCITIDEALNIPTCVLRRKHHKQLHEDSLGATTPDIAYFWRRYDGLKIQVETHDGTKIDMAVWTLENHYKYFNIA